jgi:phosphoribosylformylglycinamidine (FGAM) synthase PurS component
MINQGNYKLNVFDPKGRIILTENFKDNYFLNIENFSSGSYLFEVISEKNSEQISRRIIKR